MMREALIAIIIEWLGARYDEHMATISPGNPDYFGRREVEELADKILSRTSWSVVVTPLNSGIIIRDGVVVQADSIPEYL